MIFVIFADINFKQIVSPYFMVNVLTTQDKLAKPIFSTKPAERSEVLKWSKNWWLSVLQFHFDHIIAINRLRDNNASGDNKF